MADNAKKNEIKVVKPTVNEEPLLEQERKLDQLEADLKNSDLKDKTSIGYNPDLRYQNTGTTPAHQTKSLSPKNSIEEQNKQKNNNEDTSQKSAGIDKTNAEEKKDNNQAVPSQPNANPNTKDGNSSEEENNGNIDGDSPNDETLNNNPTQSSLPEKDGLKKKDGLEQEPKEETKDAKDEEKDPKDQNNTDKNAEPDTNQEKKDSSDKTDTKNNANNENANLPTNNNNNNNGYGALKNKPNEQQTNADSTQTARKNLKFWQRQRQNENEQGSNDANKNSTGSINENTQQPLSTRIKNGIKNFFGGKTENDVDEGDGKSKDDASNPFEGTIGKGKEFILNYLKTHPHVALMLVVTFLILFLILATFVDDDLIGGGFSGTGRCTYSLKGVLTTGKVDLEGLQVELVNCDATPSNYTVLETIDFEKYVVGVALAEVGYIPGNPEYFKTGIVAARNFALTRNTSMCPSYPDDCFYGYNPNTGKIRMRACEADQVYWDYDKDIYREDRGAISLYSPEINSGTVWKTALSQETKEEVLALANEVKGKVLLDENGNAIHTGYLNNDADEWRTMGEEGYNYEDILIKHYGGGSVSGSTCASGIIDYGDYTLSSDGHTVLHEPLDSFLEKNGTSLEAFNGLIAKNVERAGYGTRAGVVAAAVTLIAELGNNYGVKVPYYWSGGHYDGVVIGALGYWGSSECYFYANGQAYNYCGLDCSGFVPWAIKNGGFDIAQMLAGDFQYLKGVKKVRLSNSPILQPGDLLESDGHIILIVGIEESTNSYICAEASGNESGVLFTRRGFNMSGYWGIEMDGYYETHQRGN